MSPKIISFKTMFKYESNDIVFVDMHILSVKSSVKFNGGLINHDRCSTSVEGGAARESHLSPRSWRDSKAVISQNPTTPSNKWPGKINGQATITSLRLFCISSLCIYFLRFISHTRSLVSLATTPRASSFGGFPSFSHKTSHSGE